MYRKILLVTMILSVFLLLSFTTAIAQAADVSINDVEGLPGDTVQVQVSVDDATGALGIDIVIGYDSSVFEYDSISCGSLICGWSILPNDNGSGILRVSMFGTTEVSGGGVLLNVNFKIKPGAAGGTYPVTLDSCRINEGSIPTTLTNGSIKVLPFDNTKIYSISGSVFNDLNCNGKMNKKTETGISGVKLTLIPGNIDVYTASDGTYIFSNLAAGTYMITEADPVDYVSCSANTITVKVKKRNIRKKNFGDRAQ